MGFFLKFDGKSNWKAFYAKFSRYAEVSEWTEGECREQLCWCLDGKASEYYALLVERNHDMAYKDLILKLEKRFGCRELPETAQVQFNNARQTPEELLDDWADRILSLATRASRVRGGLRPRELPLCSLKPPYFPEKILVSPLSAIPFPFS
jgi:hypothetical protein